MTQPAPLLRPGGGPAQLLLDFWEMQAGGWRWMYVPPSRARNELLRKGLICCSSDQTTYSLTPSGREAAQVLAASS